MNVIFTNYEKRELVTNGIVMITVEEAKVIIENEFSPINKELTPLHQALDRVLAGDVLAPISLPPFRQSAMDGYAFRKADGNELLVTGEIRAGELTFPVIKKGEALRIFTGALVPDECDTVVMQEKTDRKENLLVISDEKLKEGSNVRPVGEQLTKGDVAVAKGTMLTPGVIGLLASLGLTEVEVYKLPTIGLAVTGDELVRPGESLIKGQIFESNSVTIETALNQKGYSVNQLSFLPDQFEATKIELKKLVDKNDVLIVTGGISVGDYDFVWGGLKELGCEILYYKIKQKPGKPMLLGKIGQKYVFALPGNPYAALSCTYQYVFAALDQLSGRTKPGLLQIKLAMAHDYNKKGDRAEFLKASISGGNVSILGAQASSMLSSFVEANAQVYVPDNVNVLREGDVVDVYLLPG